MGENGTEQTPVTTDGHPPAERTGAELRVGGVFKSYGRVEALRGVSMAARAGEVVVVTGPSGSGKSTLLNLIGTLDRADAGTILVDGRSVPEPREAVEFRRELVGFVFQDNLLLPYLSARSNIETALMATGVGHRERHQRSQELLEEIGLAHRASHLPSELSSGERQRVAVARALANRPRLLLADEPTGSLDELARDRMLDLIGALRRRHGMTVVIVTHDPALTRRADRVLMLVDGQVEAAG